MSHYLQSLPDGWSIYLWLVFACAILVTAVFFLRWAAKNQQFDEDIKYAVFGDDDKDRMSPEDFAKMQQVRAHQMELRDEVLKKRAAVRQGHHAKR
jgi:nitrogen fixation-related uncharacterized protein